MNPGDGTLVGMSVLPKGVAPEASDEEEEEEPEETPNTEEGPWLFTLTKKVGAIYTVLITVSSLFSRPFTIVSKVSANVNIMIL